MTTAEEAALARTPLAADLAVGAEAISYDQEITFLKYIKVVLPLDGFVFFIRSDLMDPRAVEAASVGRVLPPATLIVTGSLHYGQDKRQLEDETIAVNRVTFTALGPVQEFNDLGPRVIYIGEFQGNRFAFSQRSGFYQQAFVFHYRGDAIYPAMESQIINGLEGFDDRSPVVSNSLPFWLTLPSYRPPWLPASVAPIEFLLYPSFAVPENLQPPYGVVHVDPAQTRALQSFPRLGPDLSHEQLVHDSVRVTLYGVRNDQALGFQDVLNDYVTNVGTMGFMSMPIIRDEKRPQAELGILAMKKVLEAEVSYHQFAARAAARQLFKSVVPNFIIGGL